MHIPSEMLSSTVCPVTATIAVAGVVASAFALFTGKAKMPSARLFALVSTAVFGLQMLNYPIWDGVSGHLIGGVFASALLGVPAGILSMALVLLVQTLMFADGGILMLGANIFNMAIIGAGLGGLIRAKLITNGASKGSATFVASAFSVFMASIAVSGELVASGKGGVEMTASLIGIHAVLSIIEGIATVGLLKLVSAKSETEMSPKVIATLSGLVVLSLCVSPFACAFPDAFEWTMANFNALPDAPNFVSAPFADYSVSAVSNAMLSGLLAGAIGMLVMMGSSLAVSLILKRQKKFQ